MKRVKSILFSLFLVAVMALTVMPGTSVYADGTGPQGGSNSGTRPPPPPPPPPPVGGVIGLVIGWIFGPPE